MIVIMIMTTFSLSEFSSLKLVVYNGVISDSDTVQWFWLDLDMVYSLFTLLQRLLSTQ